MRNRLESSPNEAFGQTSGPREQIKKFQFPVYDIVSVLPLSTGSMDRTPVVLRDVFQVPNINTPSPYILPMAALRNLKAVVLGELSKFSITVRYSQDHRHRKAI